MSQIGIRLLAPPPDDDCASVVNVWVDNTEGGLSDHPQDFDPFFVLFFSMVYP